MQELNDGKSCSKLCKIYLPKKMEEEAKVEARQKLTKQQLFKKLNNDLKEALIDFPGDDYLLDCKHKLFEKKSRIFKTKSDLEEFSVAFETHLENLVTYREYMMYLPCDEFDT